MSYNFGKYRVQDAISVEYGYKKHKHKYVEKRYNSWKFMLKSLEGFVHQSNFVDIGLMCKQYTDLLYTMSWQGDVRHHILTMRALHPSPHQRRS